MFMQNGGINDHTTVADATFDMEQAPSNLNGTSNLSTTVSNGFDLIEPLLYTQNDFDDATRNVRNEFEFEMQKVVDDWQNKCEELENKIQEEIEMRNLIEQDHAGKTDSLRKECNDMKQVL